MRTGCETNHQQLRGGVTEVRYRTPPVFQLPVGPPFGVCDVPAMITQSWAELALHNVAIELLPCQWLLARGSWFGRHDLPHCGLKRVVQRVDEIFKTIQRGCHWFGPLHIDSGIPQKFQGVLAAAGLEKVEVGIQFFPPTLRDPIR